MSGPQAKHPSVRARANKSSTRATLTELDEDQVEIPTLPPRHILRKRDGEEYYVEIPWSPMTLEWWVDLWSSPMSSEFHSSDRHGLYRLACLIDNFWKNPTSDTHSEVRLAQKDYGLTPMDRRRLEWTIETADKARSEGDRRRQAEANQAKPPTEKESDPAQDPRIALGDNVVAMPKR